MRSKLGLFAVAALFLVPIDLLAADQTEQLTSVQLFKVHALVISDAPLSKADFEKLKPVLQKDDFSTSDGIHWRMNDASGSVLITALPDAGLFSVKYMPSAPIRLGDSVLAALIGKAVNVGVDDGDVIVVTIGTRSLSNGQHTGTRSDYLTFNLRGGMWQETGIIVDWNLSYAPSRMLREG